MSMFDRSSASHDSSGHGVSRVGRLCVTGCLTLIGATLVLVASGSATRATPSEPPLAVPRTDTPDTASTVPDPDAPDALDDWSFIPVVFYTPETSFGFGAAVIHSFNPTTSPTTQLSTMAAGVIVTTEGQVVVRLEPDFRFDDVFMQGVVRFQRYPTRFFPGGGHPGDPGEPYDELAFISNMDVRYRLGPIGSTLEHLSGGVRCDVRWNEVTEVTADGDFVTADPLGLDPYAALGCGPVLAFDTRDDVRLPSRGLYMQTRLAGFVGLYGESFTTLVGDLDLRAYVDLGKRHVLASQLVLRATLGDLPYQLLPRLGGSSLHRGWFEGHLRDQNTLLLQFEWRFPLVWKLGATVFASAGQAFDRFSELSPDGLRFAVGAGLRFFLNQRQKVNLRLDLAWGSGFAAYVDVLEAF